MNSLGNIKWLQCNNIIYKIYTSKAGEEMYRNLLELVTVMLDADAAALILAEINPAAAASIYTRAWECGVSRVISGAHWQSDVDVTRLAASIGYSRLQTSPAFRAQMALAREEFSRLP